MSLGQQRFSDVSELGDALHRADSENLKAYPYGWPLDELRLSFDRFTVLGETASTLRLPKIEQGDRGRAVGMYRPTEYAATSVTIYPAPGQNIDNAGSLVISSGGAVLLVAVLSDRWTVV